MFSFFKDARDNISLRVELEETKQLLKEAQDKLELIEIRSTERTFGFDFSVVKVFSIERNISDDKPCTIVGYVLPEPSEQDRIREWYLYCSEEQHEKLVAEFRQFQQK